MNILPASDTAILEALQVLASGGVIIHATETCYGLACDLTNPQALKRLFDIKRRPGHQPVSALFASVEQAKEFVLWNADADHIASAYMPGPITIILPRKPDASVPIFLSIEPAQSIGVRISSHPVAMLLAQKYTKPLATTSANVHGMSEAYDIDTILAQFAGMDIQPDVLLDSGALPHVPPSTIVDVTGLEPQIVRQGSIVMF
jgi:L-threonylcarbamoyladenylate synthase